MVNPAEISTPVSMTGYGSRQGSALGQDWTWELRAVNGKGLDLRLRLPEGIDGLEPAVREALGRAIARGSVQATLKLGQGEGGEAMRLNPTGLNAALSALAAIEATAASRGIELSSTSAAQILSLRGVQEQTSGTDIDQAKLRKLLIADLHSLLDDFNRMRRTEGAALGRVIAAQLERIAQLTEDAAQAAEARRPEAAAALSAALARIADAAPAIEQGRIVAELAMLAVKADIAEEIDRLRAHVAAGRGHLASPGPIGRKLDFLSQEFVREANTLCSKSGSTQLTAIGLDLKHVIDQMREQIQNLE